MSVTKAPSDVFSLWFNWSSSHLEGHEDEDFDYQDLEFMRLDTLVAERMTASPRIFAVFGLCGISSYSELALHGTIEEEIYGETMRDDEDYDYEKHGNNLCSVQKAEYCLQMAQAVADLHGHKDGVIIHEDLKADQFLWNEAKTAIKLNDFSRSVIVMWDDSTQDYCAYDENEQREWRTPEEFKWSHHITEKVDIHNLASVFYIVLLGQAKVDAMDDENDYLLEGGKVIFEQEAREKFSGAEAKLAEIIDWCQADNQEDRPSIFQVVKGLEEALELARQEEHNKLAKNR
jgi:serine/threonine protein kinase